MKKRISKYDPSVFTINPALNGKHITIKLSPEHQKKHDDLVAALARVKAKENSPTAI
jgi:hypothetical protein